MTFPELWDVYLKRNPALQKPDGRVTMKVENLRRLAEQAYEQGAKAAADPDSKGVGAFLKDFNLDRGFFGR